MARIAATKMQPRMGVRPRLTAARATPGKPGMVKAAVTIATGLQARAPALAEMARARLEEMIVTLELPPGSVWSELQLSERLGIGRTPVREALQRLQAEYLINIVPRFGAQVSEINVTQQLLLLDVRRILERLIAQDAARRATPEERERLLAMAAGLEALVEDGVLSFLRYYYDIKKLIAACARNPYAASAVAPAQAMSRRFYFLHYRVAHDLPVAARHHADVVRAIALGDEAQAGIAADRLMDYVVELTRATVTQKL